MYRSEDTIYLPEPDVFYPQNLVVLPPNAYRITSPVVIASGVFSLDISILGVCVEMLGCPSRLLLASLGIVVADLGSEN